MAETCKLCNGSGKNRYLVTHKFTKQLVTVIDWCLCKKSKIVSDSPYLRIMASMSDSYMPLEKIDPQLKFDLQDLRHSPNLIIQPETSYETFLYHVKAFLMYQIFCDPAPLIYACDSIDLLKRFYVAQDDGENVSLADTNKFDLLIFTLGAEEKNLQLNTCVSQVVANRKSICKPTWIYLKKKYDACVWEKSDVLSGFLEIDKDKVSPSGYHRINLIDVRQGIKPTQSKAKQTADKGIFR